MKNVIEKKLTNKLEKFVNAIQNPIFASRFRDKLEARLLVAGTHMETGLRFVVNKYRKTYKFVYGKDRVKAFLINNLGAFEIDHQKIVNWIENGDVEENKESYVECKNRISAVLRATRRLNSFKLADNITITAYLNEHINRKRFSSRYKLAT
jgi:hypothetical protein